MTIDYNNLISQAMERFPIVHGKLKEDEERETMENNKIVGFCVSHVHDEIDVFELLIAYADGREIGYFLPRSILHDLLLQLDYAIMCNDELVKE